MVRKGNLAKFDISKTKEATPTKIALYAFYVNLYLHEFFDLHGLKGNFGRFEGKQKGAKSPKQERPHPL